eukprot:TRINITY_DN51256_c0_g2_i1.p1 TRINITY_DN51256_c0_g2~~TRINITY_DN51256_c0_g2_i1.p1  ORF type:complete len:346 (+),score=79.48 TRINITY_DN51256_c0_g2_i1:88-1038(+)
MTIPLTPDGKPSSIEEISGRKLLICLMEGACPDADFQFELRRFIGQGAFYDVFEGALFVEGSIELSEVAIKKSRKRIRGVKDREIRLREITILQNVDEHPNIIQYHCAWQDSKHVYIAMERCAGTLLDFLKSFHFSNLEEYEALIWKVLQHISSALAFLHCQNIAHLDIKPENILIQVLPSEEREAFVCKLGDFSEAQVLSSDAQVDLWDKGGDPRYMAPEILNSGPLLSSDVFSLGIVLMQAICRIDLPDSGPVWECLRDHDFVRDALNHYVQKPFSPILRGLILSMTHEDPAQRISAHQILEMSNEAMTILSRQ